VRCEVERDRSSLIADEHIYPLAGSKETGISESHANKLETEHTIQERKLHLQREEKVYSQDHSSAYRLLSINGQQKLKRSNMAEVAVDHTAVDLEAPNPADSVSETPIRQKSTLEKLYSQEFHVDESLKAESAFEKLKHDGTVLAWKNLTLDVPVKQSRMLGLYQKNTGQTKRILDHVSGYAKPGEMVFLMGASGAGKSTLLDCLADRTLATPGGYQILGTQEKTPTMLKKAAKYVQQHDDMLGVLSVRETLETAAGFYVPNAEDRRELVEEAITMLGLKEQENVKIGNVFFRGISGGQRRRVSIGEQLVASPQIMFLDEPTSGLDSAAAFNIIRSLKQLAVLTNMTLILVVHQPSELVFEMADRLLLLAAGRTCYFGPALEAGNHFRNLGYERPERESETDWMMDLVNNDFGDKETVDRIINAWETSDYKMALDKELLELGMPEEVSTEPRDVADSDTMHYPVNFFQQTMVLTKRGILNMIRNPAVLWLRFGMYMMLAIMIGTIWLRLGDSAKVIQDINGALFYIVAFFIFMSISVLPAYLEERTVLAKERANGAYSVFAYITAHTLYEIPYVGALSVMGSLILYWLIGLTDGADRFFIFLANLFMSLLIAESIMVMISALVPILIVGIAVGAFIFGAFMCVMGFFITLDEVGWWWRWMQYIAVHYYSFSTFMYNQYHDTFWQPYVSPTGYPSYPDGVYGYEILANYALIEDIWINFLAMVAMFVIYRSIAAVYLHFQLTGKK